MRDYIKKLQSKPEPVRKQFLVGWMVVSMSLVAVVWVYSIQSTVSTDKLAKKNDAVAPFKLFGESVAKTYDSITASVGNVPAIVPQIESTESSDQSALPDINELPQE